MLISASDHLSLMSKGTRNSKELLKFTKKNEHINVQNPVF